MSWLFWVSIIIGGIAGLLGNELVVKRLGGAKNSKRTRTISWILIFLLFAGLTVAAIQYYIGQREMNTLRDEVATLETAGEALGRDVVAARRDAEAGLKLTAQHERKLNQRLLTDEQKRKLAEAFEGMPRGPIMLTVFEGTDETRAYRDGIAEFLGEKGFHIWDGNTGGASHPSPGYLVFAVNPSQPFPKHAVIVQAFRAAGFNCKTARDPNVRAGQVEIQIPNKQL